MKKLLIVMIIMLPAVIAFGTVPKNSLAEIHDGESARFEMLFWGDNESVLLWNEAPENWTVIIDARNFTLMRDQGDEYVSTKDGYSRARKISIFVKPPTGQGGSVIIGARTVSSGGMISFVDARYFNLTVRNLDKEFQPVLAAATISEPVNQTQYAIESIENTAYAYGFYASIAVVIIISALIYRRS